MPDMSAEAAAVPPQPTTQGPVPESQSGQSAERGSRFAAFGASGAAASLRATEGQSEEERLAAYQASVFAAFGGKRGLAEVGLPSVLFILVYGITRDLTGAIWGALAVALVLAVVRLVKRDTLQHTLSGLFGVLVCAAVAHFSGQAKGFYLPGVLLNIGEAILFSVSALVRWPMVGVVLGPITGEMMAWRQVPGRVKAFNQATWVLTATFLLRLAVQLPLYLAGWTTSLGIARLVLGYPVYLAALYYCWQIIKNAPPPVKPEAAEDEDGVVGTGGAVGTVASVENAEAP